jgi:hypothetical protein
LKIYARLNLFFFLIQLGFFAAVQWSRISFIDVFHFGVNSHMENKDNLLPLVPMQMQGEVETVAWMIVFAL